MMQLLPLWLLHWVEVAIAGTLNVMMIIGFVAWCYLLLVIFQLILCKDASELMAGKLLNRPLAVRWRVFKRSLHDPWYLGSLGVFFGVICIVWYLGYEFLHEIPKPTLAVFFHFFFAPSLGWLYYQRGYRAIFFVKFGDWIAAFCIGNNFTWRSPPLSI